MCVARNRIECGLVSYSFSKVTYLADEKLFSGCDMKVTYVDSLTAMLLFVSDVIDLIRNKGCIEKLRS